MRLHARSVPIVEKRGCESASSRKDRVFRDLGEPLWVELAAERHRRPGGNSAKSRSKEPTQGDALTVLSLPNMFTAGAGHGIRWSLLD